MADTVSSGAALTLPTPPVALTRADEEQADATYPATDTTPKAVCRLQVHNSKKTPLTAVLEHQPVHNNALHNNENDNRSGRNTGRTGCSKGSNGSSNSTEVSCSQAALRTEGKAATEATEVEDVSMRGAAPCFADVAPRRLVSDGNDRQTGCRGSSRSTTARRTTHPAQAAALPSPAASASSKNSSTGRAGSLCYTKRGVSGGTSSETAKQSLLGSLLMPDGVTVRKPPPLGISSGDPVGTHILRRRTTSMRTEKFSFSGQNLSLHRHAAANNSMFSWQRAFQSAPRAAASFSSPSPACAPPYSRRMRGSSFMGRPIESLPRLVAFSPSLSKALKQHAHLIPAPSVVDSADSVPAATDAVPLSTADVASQAADAAVSRRPGAASSPNAAVAFPGAAAVPSDGLRAQAEFHQQKGGKATEALHAAGSTVTTAVGTFDAVAAASTEEAAKAIEDTTAAGAKVTGELEGHGGLHDGETGRASCWVDRTPDRVGYSSSFSSSSSAGEMRRRVGGGADGKLVKACEGNDTALQHPADLLNHTAFDCSHSGSSTSRSDSRNSSSEGSGVNISGGGRTNIKASSSSRSATCRPTPHENAAGAPSRVAKTLTLPGKDAAVAGATTLLRIRPPAEIASSFPSCSEAEQEETAGQQREQPSLSPALLYQLGITKFTEGKAPEAIEAITRFLREAAAKKRQLQRQTADDSSSTCPPGGVANVAAARAFEEGRGEKEDAGSSTPPVREKPSGASMAAPPDERQQGQDEKDQKGAAHSALVDGYTAGEAGTESQLSKIQQANSSISESDPAPFYPSTDATPVSSGNSVASERTSLTATTGRGRAAHGDHARDSPLHEELGLFPAACAETRQQLEREQEARRQVGGGKEPAQGTGTDAEDGDGEGTIVKGETVKLEGQRVSRVQLRGLPTPSETASSPAQSQGRGRDYQGRMAGEESPAGKDTGARVDGRPNTPFTILESTKSAAADAPSRDTTTAEVTAADQSGAAGAPAPDITVGEATAADTDAAAADAAVDPAGADTTAVDALAAAAGTTDANDVAAAGARGEAAKEEEKLGEMCASVVGEGGRGASASVSFAIALKPNEVSVQGSDKEKEGVDGEGERTGLDRGDAAESDELEAVPVQRLFGIVFGRRLQIDRRAKDVIAGWGTPQYFHLEKLLGHLLFEEGDFPEALRHYWRCIDLRPDDSQLYTNLGLAYYEMGATEEATASFEQALKCNDRNPVALSVLAMLLMDKFEDAEEALLHQGAEYAEETGVTALDETARRERLLKGTDRCVTLLKRCVEVEEDNVLAVLHLAQVYMYREEWDKAEAIFRALLKENADDTHLLNNLGQIAMSKGDTPQALQLFERALQINPQDELAHMHMCEAFCSLKHLARALQHFRLCCEASPDNVSLHATCGLPLCEAGKEKEVVAAYTKFIKQHPDSAAARTFKRSLGCGTEQVGFLESSQIIIFIVLPILLLMVFLIGFTQLASYWSAPTDDRSLPTSWGSIYYPSSPDASS